MPDLTQFLRVGGIQYYVHNIASLQLVIPLPSSDSDGQGSLIPCTIINWDKDSLETEDLDAVLNGFILRDDVWNRSFLHMIIIRTPKSTIIRIGKCEIILTETSKDVPNGPYVVRSENGDIFGVSKLFDDQYEAFIGGSVKSNGGSFKWLGIENCIAVPSRLYYEATPTRLLSGLRFAVKDIIDVNGLETGCGNRAYRGLYPKRTASAACVQRLLNAGAIFVGKTKTTQFAEGQTPLQWCDYTAPFNPRGDTYQSPSSSSAGSAVASAAYTWLDFTIATDTGGSIRHPAGICGIYGLRPSSKAVDTSGIYSVSSLIDSVGVLARSASTVERVTRCLTDVQYPSPSVTSQVSYKLLYPVRANTSKHDCSQRWFPASSNGVTDTEACFETTVQKLESYLRCTRTFVDIDDLWYNTHPVGRSNILSSATEGIYKALSTYTNVRQVIEPFINDYKASNTGHAPAIDPIVRARQAEGRQITSSQYAAAVQSAELFSHWIINILLAPSEKDQIPLLIYPQSWGTPSYRDDSDSGPLFSSSFSIYSLSYISGAPDCTVPIGEVSRYSRVTDSNMSLPISISILGRPGTDLALMALLAKLEYKGILRPVSTGSTLYPKPL